jgi:uncharacterized protein
MFQCGYFWALKDTNKEQVGNGRDRSLQNKENGMFQNQKISVIIPAFNEAAAIGKVLDDIPAWVDEIIVVDNASTDTTAQVAQEHQARVVTEKERGYGAACLAGIKALSQPGLSSNRERGFGGAAPESDRRGQQNASALRQAGPDTARESHTISHPIGAVPPKSPDVVVFLDADYSDHPDEMEILIAPIVSHSVDLVIGSRFRGKSEPKSLTPQAYFGNWLACNLMRCIWGNRFTDLGPFRAIRYNTLKMLSMQDRNYGWTVEMQIKAAMRKIPAMEVPVQYRCRIGKSKISGTIKGVLGAGSKIVGTILWASLGGYRKLRARERVIIFTRYPLPGKTKTRLIPTLGPEKAADLQRQMTEKTLTWVRTLRRHRGVDIEVRYTGATLRTFQKWLGKDIRYCAQGHGDLGRRMSRAFRKSFLQKYQRTVIVGIDCPGLDHRIVGVALDHLFQKDTVFGLARDGGYYLVGQRSYQAAVFRKIAWGTKTVWQQTLERLAQKKISFVTTKHLQDLDEATEMPIWHMAEKRVAKTENDHLSIIIPVLNESASLWATLQSIDPELVHEVIVVDGGSSDKTLEIAKEWGATTIVTKASRGHQMHVGAQQATGDVLLFLHGDTLLPKGFGISVREVLSRPNTVAGAFAFALKQKHGRARWLEWSVKQRTRRLQLPFGDQALFIRRDWYFRVGGFANIPLMEDYDIVRRLRPLGKVDCAKAKVYTSGRRWEKRGWIKASIMNQLLQFGFRCGLSPEKLAQWYYK